MWPDCLRLGVAAITYEPLEKTDLSKYPKGEPKELWRELTSTQQASLRRVAYEMKAGDVIYVKQGTKIVSKGDVKGSYKFDSKFRLKEPSGEPWAHQVPVEWVKDFPEISILVGRSQQYTVEELTPDELKKLESAVDYEQKETQKKETLEGETYKTEAIFRSRNRTLIEAKKANSDYRCEVCGFSFEEAYGEIGFKYIVAHHLKPIAAGPSKTTLDDIALVCANCHAMIHKEYPQITIKDLRKRVNRQKRRVEK